MGFCKSNFSSNIIMLTEDQKAEICQEVATCPAYLEKLDLYERQALQHYVTGKQKYLASRPEEEQTYYRAAFPAYELADVVAALLATPAAEAAPAALKVAKPSVQTVGAIIQRGLELEDIKAIFEDIRPFIHRKGEWGTAIAALHSKGYLVGSADRLAAWFKEGQFGVDISDKTISNCIKAYKDEAYFSKDEQHVIDSVIKWADAKSKG